MHFRGLLPFHGILPGGGAKLTLRQSLAFCYWQRYCTALQQQTSAKLCGVVQGMKLLYFRRSRHLYWLGDHHVGIGPHSSFVNVAVSLLFI